VDAVLKGGDGKAGELHGIKAKQLRGLSWSEKERGELTTARRSTVEGERDGDPVETKSRKANNGHASGSGQKREARAADGLETMRGCYLSRQSRR
jgi:hypothetical protein